MRHPTSFLTSPLALGLFMLCAVPAQADEGRRTPPNPQYQQECGSCHVAFPARLLDEGAWRKTMGSLDKHFGTDASLDAATREAITKYLVANSARRERPTPQGQPTQRITETAWFKREHSEVGSAVWQRASIKMPSNCAACHTQAEQGSFGEHQIRIPK
ncbi:diheme cytochrome c [Uliginosibacterium gangwonense]|uniref:diheme cytochrome c n=1 Tax=Uliginosibacterium gangwonense TaxID=392736 RepID=UPI000370D3A4|nr:diheme cytochrome c [Uliginosibacterium gangwonense]